ncbi:MAG: DUF547 domain-containing protein [Desulfuromusa sp.]|jgi:hypothetical protein|nr:DUF547 domain-containing protein [Desulfuromusa sp.]
MRSIPKILFITILLLIVSTNVYAAPKAELWPRWQVNAAPSSVRVDHSAWAQFLDKYLVVGKVGSANLVRYAEVSSADKDSLAQYLTELSAVPMSKLNRAEQKSTWINLYNALTVHTILDHYPVKSIRDISSGWFSGGPWDLKLVRVEEIELSLNDIEHRILRPIWQDNRVHYAVNCASLGCPNLQSEPFTAENSERLLTEAARDFINSPRGVDINDKRLLLSSIYEWFQVDFGASETALLSHLERFAAADLAANLKNYRGTISYQYNWDLNKE